MLLTGFEFLFIKVVESILFMIQSVSGYVDATEDTYLPAILDMLPRIPTHPYVSQTALLMIGKLTFQWYIS